jgi:hypothetical protein
MVSSLKTILQWLITLLVVGLCLMYLFYGLAFLYTSFAGNGDSVTPEAFWFVLSSLLGAYGIYALFNEEWVRAGIHLGLFLTPVIWLLMR